MMLNLRFDPDRAALNDLVLMRQMRGLNENQYTAFLLDHAEEIRDMIARMTIDSEGNQVSFVEAQRNAGAMPLSDLQKCLSAVTEKVAKLEEKAGVTPTNGSGSS